MGELCKVKTLCVVGLLLLSNPLVSVAQSCSLVVKVVDARDRELPGTAVTLEEQNGRKVTVTSRLGGARFCDLGVLSVTITVGHPACNQVTLHNIPLEWGQTRTAKVIYDREPCLIDTPPIAACSVLFRFADEQGHWISGVSFNSPDPSIFVTEPRQSDEFGRIFVSFAAAREPHLEARMAGYTEKTFDLKCTKEQRFREEMVTLHKTN